MDLYQKKKLFYSNNLIIIDIGNTYTKFIVAKNIDEIKKKIKFEKFNNNYCFNFLFFEDIIKFLNIKKSKTNNYLFIKILNNEILNLEIFYGILKIIKRFINHKLSLVVYSEVNERVFSHIKKLFNESFSRDLSFIEINYKSLDSKINFNYNPPESYGKDRIAGLLYYFYLSYFFFDFFFDYACIFNCGTALVLDEISKVSYLGGSISISPFNEFKTLKIFTDKLPDITEKLNLNNFQSAIDYFIKNSINLNFIFDKNNIYFCFSNKCIGKSTSESILNGVVNGFLYKLSFFILKKLKKDFQREIFIFNGEFFNKTFFYLICLYIKEINENINFNKKIIFISFNDNLIEEINFKIKKNDNFINEKNKELDKKEEISINKRFLIRKKYSISILNKNGKFNSYFLKKILNIRKYKNVAIFIFDCEIPLKGILIDKILENFTI
ncbi:MAG: type III pantothenate kinase [Spirochaetes bacterium]|nr:type III pantothenate kinase [Spirochaetota bacterium]